MRFSNKLAAFAAMSAAMLAGGTIPASGMATSNVGSEATASGERAHKPAQRHNVPSPASSLLDRLLGGFGRSNSRGQQRRAAFGWTNRHAVRVANKKRRVQKHRAARRGKG